MRYFILIIVTLMLISCSITEPKDKIEFVVSGSSSSVEWFIGNDQQGTANGPWTKSFDKTDDFHSIHLHSTIGRTGNATATIKINGKVVSTKTVSSSYGCASVAYSWY